MSSPNLNSQRAYYVSPLQLLISLTAAFTIILFLLVAGALGISAVFAILTGAMAFTLGRIVKRVYLSGQLVESNTGGIHLFRRFSIHKGLVKVFDIYLSRIFISSFFYGIGISTQVIASALT